jgi:hypothetical protein
MIKLGIFGDHTTDPKLLEQLKTLPDTEQVGIYFSGNTPVPDGYNEILSPVGLMDISDAILILTERSISSDLIRLILRKSKHVYLKTIPNLNVKEIKELIDLEKEAGIVTSIFNPFDSIAQFDLQSNRYEKPLLINLRTCFESSSVRPSHEILLLSTAINRVVKSNYKKLEIFGMRENGAQIVINLRVEYENGSVINLTISQEKSPGFCEIFDQQKRTRFDFQTLSELYLHSNQEYNSIAGFVSVIQCRDKKTHAFDNFRNGVQIVHEIREHLRFNEIDF